MKKIITFIIAVIMTACGSNIAVQSSDLERIDNYIVKDFVQVLQSHCNPAKTSFSLVQNIQFEKDLADALRQKGYVIEDTEGVGSLIVTLDNIGTKLYRLTVQTSEKEFSRIYHENGATGRTNAVSPWSIAVSKEK